MLDHLNINLYGKVQGVFLRRAIQRQASRLGLTGFVKNEPDGTVYLEVEGEMQILEQFLQWLKSGADPPVGESADYQIKEVDSQKGHFKAFNGGFEIK